MSRAGHRQPGSLPPILAPVVHVHEVHQDGVASSCWTVLGPLTHPPWNGTFCPNTTQTYAQSLQAGTPPQVCQVKISPSQQGEAREVLVTYPPPNPTFLGKIFVISNFSTKKCQGSSNSSPPLPAPSSLFLLLIFLCLLLLCLLHISVYISIFL